MSRSLLWSTAVFIVFAFATLMVFFWIREGSLEEAGASLDRTLNRAGGQIVQLRPSGNAPEFRCYVEAESESECTALLADMLDKLRPLLL